MDEGGEPGRELALVLARVLVGDVVEPVAARRGGR